MPSNCPHWNPGPGEYKAVSIYKGGSTQAGKDVPKATFGNSRKLVSPEARLSATVFISNVSIVVLIPATFYLMPCYDVFL
jgi:hypothetical protein